MQTIGAYDAKTHLPRLLDEIDSGGKTFVITKNGRPVARLGPARGRNVPPGEVIAALRAAREGARLDGLKVRDLIDEGRR